MIFLKKLTLIITLIFTSILSAQDEIYIEFLRIDNNPEYGNDSVTCFYHFKDNLSEFSFDLKKIDKKTAYFDEKDELKGDFIIDNNKVLKNFKEKKIYSTPQIIYFKDGIIKEDLDAFKWKISEKEFKEILGYNCKLAQTTYKGREYDIYYTDEIKISDGPYKFNGLPGIILYAKEKNGRIEYIANKINSKNYKNIKMANFPNSSDVLDWNTAIREASINYQLIKEQLQRKFHTTINVDASNSIEIYDLNNLLTPNSLCVEYQSLVDYTTKEINQKIESLPTFNKLCINNFESYYTNIERVNNQQPTDSKYTVYLNSSNYYKDLSEKKYLSEEETNGKKFLVYDTIPTLKWKILRDNKKTIEGYSCTMAKAMTKNGYEITAWYSSEIPISNGPMLYGGLPGLILEIEEAYITENSTEIRKYTLSKIEKPKEKFSIKKPTASKTYTQAEYDVIEKEMYEKQFKMQGGGVDKDL